MKNDKLNKNGFTLVELLAVIVILAIIMIIAVPSVLNTLTTARQKTNMEMMQKIYNLTNQKIVEDQMLGVYSGLNSAPSTVYWSWYFDDILDLTDVHLSRIMFYDIRRDIGLQSPGEWFGTVVVYFVNDGKYIYYYDLFNEDTNYYWWSIDNSFPEYFQDFCHDSDDSCSGKSRKFGEYKDSQTNTGYTFLANYDINDNYARYYYSIKKTRDGKYMKDIDYVYVREDLNK